MKKTIIILAIAFTFISLNIQTSSDKKISICKTQIISNTAFAANNDSITLIEKPDTLPGPTDIDSKNPRNYITSIVLPKIAVWLISIIGGISVIFIIIGGLRLTIGLGEDDEYEKGKEEIKYAIIGFLLSILSYAIISLVTNVKFTETPSSSETSAIEIINNVA